VNISDSHLYYLIFIQLLYCDENFSVKSMTLLQKAASLGLSNWLRIRQDCEGII